VRFLITGGIAAGVNVAMRWAFGTFMIFEAAVAAAYLVAMTVAFVLSRLFVFERSGNRALVQFTRFALVNLVSLIVVWSVSVSLYRLIFPLIEMDWYPATVAHLVGVLSPVFIAYFLHKGYTFAPAREGSE